MSLDQERQSRRDRVPVTEPGPSHSVPCKALRGPVGIRHGVRQMANKLRDQENVMDMLDNLRVEYGGNRRADGTLEVWWPLPTEGRCHPVLHAMILRAQNYFYTRGLLGVRPDGVIDPGGRTQALIMQHSGARMPHAMVNPMALAKAAVPLAIQWATGANTYLIRYKAWRLADRAFDFDPTAANVHLHLDSLGPGEVGRRIDEWVQNYQLLQRTLFNPDGVFVAASREEALAARNEMNCWGQAVPAWARPNDHIWFGPDMLGLGLKCRAAILLHEGGHYIRAKIGHQGGERGDEYDNQSADEALTSAYVCANFATHATTGIDERYGLARPSE